MSSLLFFALLLSMSARRLAAAAVVQRPLVESEFNDTLFVMGGFGGWPEDDARYNGMRCRNDVYKTKDGGERDAEGGR